jgi:hypothetical protein
MEPGSDFCFLKNNDLSIKIPMCWGPYCDFAQMEIQNGNWWCLSVDFIFISHVTGVKLLKAPLRAL